jgi:hypothetical protein
MVPRQLGGRLVRREPQALAGQREALDDRAQVLPAEGRADGLAAGPVPDDGGGPLVGDAHGVDRAGCRQHLLRHRHHDPAELGGVDLDEPRERGRRRERPVGDVVDRAVGPHDRRSQPARADVDHQDGHWGALRAQR